MLQLATILLPLSTFPSMGVSLDAIGWKVVQLFKNVNTSGFLLLPLEWDMCDTSHNPMTPRATLTFKWKEKHINQLETRNMNGGKGKIDSD
jgi:hypothetical protein